MKPSLIFLLLLFRIAGLSQTMTDGWQGLLVAGPQKIKIRFHISDSLGKYSSSFDSPDQSVYGLACSETNRRGDSIEMLIKVINGGYRGKWDGKDSISGYYFQNGMQFPTGLHRMARILRPQTPAPPFPYRTEELKYNTKEPGQQLAGTLSFPNSGGPFPAIILITGSGQQDRDETLFGHKPFAVIADYLTRHGYAVLRVDDRGIGGSTGNFAASTTRDFADDVEASLAQLRRRADIDPKKTGLMGHSEGGLIAPMVAAETPGIDFIILLAGPGLKGADLLGLQNEAIDLSKGASRETAAADKNLRMGLMQALLGSSDTTVQMQVAMNNFSSWKAATPASIVAGMGLASEPNAKNFISLYMTQMRRPWMLYYLKTDPAVYLVQVKCKVLALNGAKDIQVIADPNLAGIDSALKKSKARIYSTQKLPGLNHLFQRCNTCTPEEYGELEETIFPGLLQIMSDWLDKNVK